VAASLSERSGAVGISLGLGPPSIEDLVAGRRTASPSAAREAAGIDVGSPTAWLVPPLGAPREGARILHGSDRCALVRAAGQWRLGPLVYARGMPSVKAYWCASKA
jgi:hypothetical protein